MRTMLNIRDLEIGFMGFENGQFIAPPKEGMSCILLKEVDHAKPGDSICEGGKTQLMDKRQPFVISDVDQYNDAADNFLSRSLVAQKVKSYLITPVMHEGDVMGFLELGSPRTHELNTGTIKMLEYVLPILGAAAHRFQEEHRNRVEALIQSECTTIHSSVKWRFEEAATNYLAELDAGGEPMFKDIVFKHVFPCTAKPISRVRQVLEIER